MRNARIDAFLLSLVLLVALNACSPDGTTNLPVVQTNNAITITDTTFECSGTILSDGGNEITSRGVCWSSTGEPIAVEGFKTDDGVGTGTYRSKIVHLQPETKYYYRAYAINSEGTAYGVEKSFVTKKEINLPTVSTNAVTSIELISAVCGGQVEAMGGDSVTRYGICWDTQPNPTTSSSTMAVLTYSTRTFSCNLEDLNPSTTYYVRAFAVNSKGVAYGETQVFKTKIFPAFEMVSLTGGAFQMGSNSGLSDEQPIHSVTVHDFKIGKTEVTVGLWNAVMPERYYRPDRDDLPIGNVSIDLAMEFASRLSLATKKNYRLPTEAEWEFAAGNGSGNRSLYAGGANDTLDFINRAWCYLNADGVVHPVAQLTPNVFGIYDMGGNLMEWCNDWYGEYASASVENPKGPSTGLKKVLRGGSYADTPNQCRTTIRRSMNPALSNSTIGFRIATNN